MNTFCENLLRLNSPLFFAVNKMDRIDPAEYDAFLREVAAKRDFAAVIPPYQPRRELNLDQLERP